MVWQLCTILVAHLIGLLFLFLFWREGLYIFLFAVCARLSQYLFFNISRQRLSPWGTFICWIGILFEFTILAVAFFGPAKLLFQRRKLLRFKLGWRVVSLLVIWVVLLVTSLILGFKHGWRRIRDWPDLCVLLAIVIIGPLSFWWDRRCLAKIAHMAQVDRDKILSGMSAWKRENYVKALERYNAERSDKPNITPATPASNPGHPEP